MKLLTITLSAYDYVMILSYCPFVREIQQSQVDSLYKVPVILRFDVFSVVGLDKRLNKGINGYLTRHVVHVTSLKCSMLRGTRPTEQRQEQRK